MRPALVFDLDDTLYPERQFIRSGFHAVAFDVMRRFAVPRRAALVTLFRALRLGNRSRALQELCRQHDLPATLVSELIELIRAHEPKLRLPAASAHTLAVARKRGWSLGVLTNGFPEIQARKAAALGLGGLVDAVVCAHACGLGLGKPASEPFQAILAQLGAEPEASVFVGDDPWNDIRGARLAGLRTILLYRREKHGPLGQTCEPDVVVNEMDEVIPAVERLWRGRVD